MSSSRSLYVGLMSGTSADGVNAALVSFQGTQPVLVSTHYVPYTAALRNKVMALFQPGIDHVDSFCQLDIELGRFFAVAVNQLLEAAGVDAGDIDAIGSHGQTIRHRPDYPFPFTLQIADPNTIAELTGITTVADFRGRDMAAGGQGAPLVPAFHRAVFGSDTYKRAIVNIGGIANVTILTPDNSVLGFDCGPGNGLLDAWCSLHIGKSFDEDGAWSSTGQQMPTLLHAWQKDAFFARIPPKSTGKEVFNEHWLTQVTPLIKDFAPQDVAATLVELTAWSITDAIESFCGGVDEVFVCGGGAHNSYLMRRLAALVGSPVQSTAGIGVEPDWVEAMAFAWLAWARLKGVAGNIGSVTGAKGPRVLGAIYSF